MSRAAAGCRCPSGVLRHVFTTIVCTPLLTLTETGRTIVYVAFA